MRLASAIPPSKGPPIILLAGNLAAPANVERLQNGDTAVDLVNARTTRITNRRNGRVTQIIINTLSEDGSTSRTNTSASTRTERLSV